MRPPPRTWRVALAVVGIGALASCSAPAGTRASTRSDRAPVVTVAHGRFVDGIDLDGGELTVAPPPSSVHARLSLAAATTLFRSADAVDGTYDFSVVGLGVVTLTPPGSTPPTTVDSIFPTTTAPAGGALAAPTTGAPPSTTSSTAPPATTSPTTSAAGGTPSTSAPGTTPLPAYDQRLAWVGMAWNGACPAGAGTSTSDTPLEPGAPTRYSVVLFDADTGKDALAYTSRGPSTCGGPVLPPSLARPDQLVSVAWTPVGPDSTAVTVGLPPCGTFDGWTELAAPSAGAVEVLAKVPYDPSCGTGAVSQVVDDVVPLGSGAQGAVPHAPLGAVAAEHTLPGGDGGERAQTALAG